MTKRERFVLTLTLEKIGLGHSQANRVINLLNYRNNDYETILSAIEDIKKYFKSKDYSESSINTILTGPRIYECSIEKIQNVEKVFNKNHYSEQELEKVEASYPHIFCHQPAPLDKKLMYYNDISIKNIIIIRPRNLMQGLKLTYARHSFLSDNHLFQDNQKRVLFLDENAFTKKYGVNNRELLTAYPIKEEKYLVKKVSTLH